MATKPEAPEPKVDEKEAAQAAKDKLSLPFKAGEVIPEDFENPEIGSLQHFCVDPQGRYQPTWFQLKLHNYDKKLMSRQFFQVNGNAYYVRVGTWVDVPPDVVVALESTEIEVVQMDYDGTDLVTNDFVPVVVDKVPRFPYNLLPSARA